MKKLVTYLSLFICACFLFISCGRNYSVSFTKRHYRNGYFVNFSNEKSSLKERKKILAQKEKIDLTINDKPQSFSTNESLADNISSPISKSENSEINTNKQNKDKISLSDKLNKNSTTSNTSVYKKSKILLKNELRNKITNIKNFDDTNDSQNIIIAVIVILLLLWLLAMLNHGWGIGGLYHLLLLVILILLILWLLGAI